MGISRFKVIAVIVFVSSLITSNAYAYLDPGSGSMILQLLLGGVAGAAMVIKLYWHKLLDFLGINKQKHEESQT